MSEIDEAIKEFVIECHENLAALEGDLLGLEKKPTKENLKSIFRVFHTIKGSAGFLGLNRLEKLTHAAENLLAKLRDGNLVVSLPIINALLNVLDATRGILAQVEKTGAEGAFDPSILIENLHLLSGDKSSEKGPEGQSKSQQTAPVEAAAQALTLDTGTFPPVTPPHQKDEEFSKVDSLIVKPLAQTLETGSFQRERQEGKEGTPPAESKSEIDEAIKEFVIECHENLAALEGDLLGLEKKPSKENLKSIFRVFHTIKGSAGFLGLNRLEKLTHAAENLLAKLRDGNLAVSLPIINALLNVLDATRGILAQVEKTGAEGAFDPGILIENLRQVSGDKSSEKGPEGQSKSQQTAPVEAAAPALTLDTGTFQPFKPSPQETTFSTETIEKGNLAESTVRIPTQVLDKLLELASELVLARNQVLQCSAKLNDPSLTLASRQVNQITSALQENLMKTRMQPIGNIFNKLPRVVREIANDLGKRVRLEMQGEKTELDKTLLEAVKDPLVHLIRNAVDHGIEAPSQRKAAGKTPEGILLLYAYHESSQVNLVLSDDGVGIDLEKVRRKAVEKSLITDADAVKLNDTAAMQLIFHPGFSTAEKLSNISGRGVGMDVVKNSLERIGGSVQVQSKLGNETTIHLRIPLTLAILKALTVYSLGESFAIPQANITELLRLEGEKLAKQLELVPGGWLLRFRKKLVPLVFLSDILQGNNNSQCTLPQGLSILLLQTDDFQFGLAVDGVGETHEIVVKPLPRKLKDLYVYAGATITSEGAVQLIFDVPGLARWAHLLEKREGAAWKKGQLPEEKVKKQSSELLLVSAGDDSRYAIPLDKVERLEEFPLEKVEKSGDRLLAHYRQGILPLMDLGDLIEGKKGSHTGPLLPVVVYRHQGQLLGLTVNRIVDTVAGSIGAPGGAGIVAGKITGFPDLPRLLAARAQVQGDQQ